MVALSSHRVDTRNVEWTYDPVKKTVTSDMFLDSMDARQFAMTVNEALETKLGNRAAAKMGEDTEKQTRAIADQNEVVVRNITAEEFKQVMGPNTVINTTTQHGQNR